MLRTLSAPIRPADAGEGLRILSDAFIAPDPPADPVALRAAYEEAERVARAAPPGRWAELDSRATYALLAYLRCVS